MLPNPTNPPPKESETGFSFRKESVPALPRYDLEVLRLQAIDSDLQRGRKKVSDPRRLNLAITFVAAAVREMEHATQVAGVCPGCGYSERACAEAVSAGALKCCPDCTHGK
jgi:hypothetical protein